MNRNHLNLALFLLLAIFWSGSFIAIKEVVQWIDPRYAAFYRLVVASLALGIAAILFRKSLKLNLRECRVHWGLGVLGIGLPFVLLFWGQQSVSAGVAGMLNGSVPIWTTLFLTFVSMEKGRSDLNPKNIFGIGLGFIGIVLVFLPLLGESTNSILGGLAILGMACCYALANVVNRLVLTKPNASKMQAVLFQQHLASVAFLGIIAFAFGEMPSQETLVNTKWVIPSILYLGLFSTALALSIYFYLLKEMGSLKTSSITYLMPAISLLLDFLFFGTIPYWQSIVGILLVFLGVFYIRSSVSPSATAPNQIEPQQKKGNA